MLICAGTSIRRYGLQDSLRIRVMFYVRELALFTVGMKDKHRAFRCLKVGFIVIAFPVIESNLEASQPV